MTIWNKVWPSNKAPIKEEIERMYKCAYYVDRAFFKPSDLVDFGLDFYKLKEAGEVEMKKDLAKLRPHVQGLWDRMNTAQRTMFLYSYFALGCQYLGSILGDMEPLLGGDLKPEMHFLNTLISKVNQKFPAELQDKLNEGFGKEWSK